MIIGHIIGLDEIHKRNLLKELPDSIKIIDLDNMQQIIYNDTEIANQKIIWADISKTILEYKKQRKIAKTKIKKLFQERKNVKKYIHELWHNKMSKTIDAEISNAENASHILFVGFNIFPKDYRVKINIPVSSVPNSEISNKIIFDTEPNNYASNQIKFYLNKYSEKIIRGEFPLNLLKVEYLENKYQKFRNFYEKHGYSLIKKDQLVGKINNIGSEIVPLLQNNKIDIELVKGGDSTETSVQKNSSENVSTADTATTADTADTIYVAILFKSGNIIPVNGKTPIEGFLTKEEAIQNIRPKLKRNAPIYLYKVGAEQFDKINGKIMATKTLVADSGEAFLLSQ
ncbi:MAG: hypothetical protein Satyrvirus4_26 [Satyrvirus sp.]|uniref:Uncharacterized protein n=1 Tax=Satyrvirus sp. TaxID=2487771 RepID=A0A3G5AI96_9VIRU|nr:MAG: hypothetical protein Satyrvirus4_26 [Satyrvirus sp.]